MNTIITAAVAGLTSSSTDDSQLRQGANQTPIPKVWAQHIVTVLATELKPITLVRMDSQGATTQTVIASHYGPCPEVPDGHNMAGIVPLVAGTQMKDDFGLPIAGAPAPNQKLLMTQVTPGDSYAMGVSSVSPDGVTSPAIPNSGDVTPGTAASNPASYLTGPVTKQHPWLTDIVAGCGIQQTAYGKYDYTDPTGTLHTALGKGDTKVKKPLLEIKRATNTTPLYSGQVTLAGSSPTEYLHSGVRCADDAGENHGLVVNTKWGTNIDKDDAVDVWLAASTTLPTAGEGDQTARALPCYDGDVYNTSALGEDGGDSGHALYVKIDGTSIQQDATGALKAVSGSAANATVVGFSSDIDLSFEIWHGISWDGVEYDTSAFWAMAHPTRLTVPTTGRYTISGQVQFKTTRGAGDDTFHGKLEIWLNGNPGFLSPGTAAAWGWCEFPDLDDRVTVSMSRDVSLTAGDYVELYVAAESGLQPWATEAESWFSIKQVS